MRESQIIAPRIPRVLWKQDPCQVEPPPKPSLQEYKVRKGHHPVPEAAELRNRRSQVPQAFSTGQH